MGQKYTDPRQNETVCHRDLPFQQLNTLYDRHKLAVTITGWLRQTHTLDVTDTDCLKQTQKVQQKNPA